MNTSPVTLEALVSLCKRRGFIYQGSEIYGGLSGTWDYGPLGVTLKRNLMHLWWRMFVEDREDMFGLDSAILMNHRVWEASGHTGAGFADPLVEDVKTKKRYRADHVLEDNGIDPTGMNLEQISAAIAEHSLKSADGNDFGPARQFNMMFKTNVGPVEDDDSISYLRPETAQGIFVNFKNILDSFYPDMPFGIAQQGKAFRNEISPRDFIFRVREFEQMEIEYFISPDDWETHFNNWVEACRRWFDAIGLSREHISELEVPEADRAHYSKRTIDFEYTYPFGSKEILGLAYRTDFDLNNHQQHSGKSMEYRPKDGSPAYVPHVIEPSFGVDRTVLAVLAESYRVDEMNGDQRVYLALPNHLAPVKYCVSPLLKNKAELVQKAQQVYKSLQDRAASGDLAFASSRSDIMWDDNGNIGKRYRKQDEIGTPFCIVIDFESLDSDTVTVRDRDSGQQSRVSVSDIGKA